MTAFDVPTLVLTGPTGAGKSDWAMRLAEFLPIEIVSADSAQVYRGLDIGTAKPDAAAQALVRHHLLDLRDPAERYSAGEFLQDARAAIEDIRLRERVPVVVGGTMLYLKALLGGLAVLPRADAAIRAQIDAEAARDGWPALHAELARSDPLAAARIHPHDSQRIQRALEVWRGTGRPISSWQAHSNSAPVGMGTFRRWAIVPEPRSVLHERIGVRLEAMMAAGFLDEMRRLYERGDLSAEHPSMRSVGYRQLWSHLAGECGLDVAVERAKAATRQLAKRQMTWLNADNDVERLDPGALHAFDRWRNEAVDAVRR